MFDLVIETARQPTPEFGVHGKVTAVGDLEFSPVVLADVHEISH